MFTMISEKFYGAGRYHEYHLNCGGLSRTCKRANVRMDDSRSIKPSPKCIVSIACVSVTGWTVSKGPLFSIRQDAHHQVASWRYVYIGSQPTREKWQTETSQGDTHPLPHCSPLRDPVWTQGGWGTGNVLVSCEAKGVGPQWDVSVHSGTPLFRSVRSVPMSTGPPHRDKVTGPRVRGGVEVGGVGGTTFQTWTKNVLCSTQKYEGRPGATCYDLSRPGDDHDTTLARLSKDCLMLFQYYWVKAFVSSAHG